MASNELPDKTVIPECGFTFEYGGASLEFYNDCKKNPGHMDFFPVKELESLPEENQTPEMMEEVFRRCMLTVLVKVKYKSKNREKEERDVIIDEGASTEVVMAIEGGNTKVVRLGTGSIAEVFYYQPVVGRPCPCPECTKSPKKKKVFWWVCVRTATHVIYDSSEAKKAMFDCFYDSEDKNGVKTLYGVDVFNIMPKSETPHINDAIYLWAITHDHETVAILNEMQPSKKFIVVPQSVKSYTLSKIIVSHPHGCSKRFSAGDVLHLTVPVEDKDKREKVFSINAVYRQFVNPVQSDDSPSNSRLSKSTNLNVDSIGEKYEKDAKNSTDKGVKVLPGRSANGQGSESTKHNFYSTSLETLFNKVRNSSEFTEFEEILSRINAEGEHTPNESLIKEPMKEFYFTFITHSCLMHLFVEAVEQKRRLGWGDGSTKEAVKDIFDIFLSSNYVPSSVSNEKETQETVFHHWVNVMKECGTQMIKYRSTTGGASSTSLFLDIFTSVKNKIEEDITEHENDKHATQKEVIELFKSTKNHCLKKFQELSNTCRPGTEDGGGTHEEENKNEEETEKKRDWEAKEEQQTPTEGSQGQQGQVLQEEPIPKGTKYILPENAEYEFRLYEQSPNWLTFPPGTRVTLPDGTPLMTGEEKETVYEFKDPDIVLHSGYLTYAIHTCKGCSGAASKFDTTGYFARTFFPHSGYEWKINRNRSGTQRESNTLTYPQLIVSPTRP